MATRPTAPPREEDRPRPGVEPPVKDAIEALEDAPESPERPEDPEAEQTLAFAQERVTALVYLLMRDVLPTGAVSQLTERVCQFGKGFDYSSDEMEALARRYTARLFSTDVADAPMPKHMREWVASFPDRIRQSPHFEEVLAEIALAQGRDVTPNDRTRAYVLEAVVKRQRAERDARVKQRPDTSDPSP